MHTRISPFIVFLGVTLLLAGIVCADISAPPVNQTIGTPDVAPGAMEEADCRVCHDSGVPDRHHLLYGQPIPDGSLVPFPDTDGDGNPDTSYKCLNCHDENFTVVGDCVVCHTATAHHSTPAAQSGDCVSCHGDLVDNMSDGHYIPNYEPSLVTPAAGGGDAAPLNGRGNGAGACNYCHDDDGLPTPIILANAALHHSAATNCSWCHAADGLVSLVPHTDDKGGFLHARDEKKPFSSGCTNCHGVDLTGSSGPSCFSCHVKKWDETEGEALSLVPHTDDKGGFLHARDEKKPFSSGCTNCHGLGLTGSSGPSCFSCHEQKWEETAADGSFNFTIDIRTCERCHGPESLHNIQADSPKAPAGTIVVGGEDAGYGHVGRDAGPNDSDCWGCHGFAMATAPRSGPLIPTLYYSDRSTVTAGKDTLVVLTGSAFTNYIGDLLLDSDVALTAEDGPSVTLTPDIIVDQGEMAVTIPGDTAPGNYSLRAVKGDFASNPVVISVVPEVVITEVTSDGNAVTISGSGFGGYAEGSGTSVTAELSTGQGKKGRTTESVAGTIVSWTDTTIEVEFASSPKEVTVHSVFGTAKSDVDDGDGGGKPDKPRVPKK